MALIDARGRLLGRWSIIDLAVIGVVLGLVAIGFGGLMLFRTPVPSVASIVPNEIAAEQVQTLSITGENFRLGLNVQLGQLIVPLQVTNRSTAEVSVAGLPPGNYDFVLLDQGLQLAVMPGALTVASPPEIELQALGAFVYFTEPDAARIRAGTTLDVIGGQGHGATVGEVLAVRPPEPGTQRLLGNLSDSASVVTALVPDNVQVPAIVRFRCLIDVDRCRVNGIHLVRFALLPLAVSGSGADPSVEHVVFRVDEVRSAAEPPTFPSEPLSIELQPVSEAFSMEMQAVGNFINLSQENALRVQTGSQFGPIFARSADLLRADLDADVTAASVVATRAPETGTLQVRVAAGQLGILSSPIPGTWQVPAIVILRCVVNDVNCLIGESTVSQGAVVPLSVPLAKDDWLTNPVEFFLFRIDSLSPVGSPVAEAVVRVQFLATPEVVGLAMAGDEDVSGPVGFPTEPEPETTDQDATRSWAAARPLRAMLVSIDTEAESIVSTTSVTTSVGAMLVEETRVTFEATLKVPVTLTPTGWQYADWSVKVGERFKFEGPKYVMDGRILAVQEGLNKQSAAR